MFNFLKISEGVREIALNIVEHPHDWIQTDYYFVNKKNPDIRIWTASGAFSLQFRGFEGLNFKERHYLNRAIKKSIANKLNIKS